MSPPLVALPDAAAQRERRVLIVDGEAARAAELARPLRDSGTVARMAVANVERARAFAPHLVLAAFDAVAADELAFVRALGRIEEAPPTPVVVVLDGDGPSQRLQALAAGAADCFAWPLDPRELLARVEMHARQADRMRALWAASYRDALTGLLNRRGLLDLLRREIDRSTRRDEPLAILFLDLDGFKQVNDRHGHEVGDELLCHVAALLARSLRAGDAIARLGGDEFVIVLPRRDAAGARTLARRLELRLAQKIRRARLGASVGVAMLERRSAGDSAETLLARADRAMYARKLARSPR